MKQIQFFDVDNLRTSTSGMVINNVSRDLRFKLVNSFDFKGSLNNMYLIYNTLHYLINDYPGTWIM